VSERESRSPLRALSAGGVFFYVSQGYLGKAGLEGNVDEWAYKNLRSACTQAELEIDTINGMKKCEVPYERFLPWSQARLTRRRLFSPGSHRYRHQ
jgi:hypothetical protein